MTILKYYSKTYSTVNMNIKLGLTNLVSQGTGNTFKPEIKLGNFR